MLATSTASPESQDERIAGSGSFLKKRTKKLLLNWGTGAAAYG